MKNDWGIIGCAYMSREYCKVLRSRAITPQVYSRDLASPNVKSFEEIFPEIAVQDLSNISDAVSKWIVCTNIESHEYLCNKLQGRIYCEKPFSHTTDYDAGKDISILLNRRYYYWVNFIREVISSGRIVKILACIPEKSRDALITQSIHVIDLLWYLAGPFQSATKVGNTCPTYVFSTDKDVPIVLNMNYGSYENFSLRFYRDDGVVYQAKPLESFSIAEGMEVREPDDDMPLRSYRPVSRSMVYTPTNHKPGLEELVDDLIQNVPTRLPTLSEHHRVHVWMEENML